MQKNPAAWSSRAQRMSLKEIGGIIRLHNDLVGVEYDLSFGKWSFYTESTLGKESEKLGK